MSFYHSKVKVKIIIIDNLENKLASSKLQATIAFGKVIEKENPQLRFLYLKVSNSNFQIDWQQLENMSNQYLTHEFMVDQENKLFYKSMVDFNSPKDNLDNLSIIPQKAYLVTGGTGKIGQMIAQKISKRQGIPILIGRSKKDEVITKITEQIKSALYFTCDVVDQKSIETLLSYLERKFGGLQGVFHCAGVNHDGLFYRKNLSEIKNTVSPKVAGTINLDYVTRNQKLDFFIMISSISATLGNVGQCDYAYANKFMDNFSQTRNNLVSNEQRFGQTISISLPYIKNGGMKMNPKIQSKMVEETGIEDLPLSELFEKLTKNYQTDHVNIFPGDKNKIMNYFGGK
jgi:hypothetical protein